MNAKSFPSNRASTFIFFAAQIWIHVMMVILSWWCLKKKKRKKTLPISVRRWESFSGGPITLRNLFRRFRLEMGALGSSITGWFESQFMRSQYSGLTPEENGANRRVTFAHTYRECDGELAKRSPLPHCPRPKKKPASKISRNVNRLIFMWMRARARSLGNDLKIEPKLKFNLICSAKFSDILKCFRNKSLRLHTNELWILLSF